MRPVPIKEHNITDSFSLLSCKKALTKTCLSILEQKQQRSWSAGNFLYFVVHTINIQHMTLKLTYE